MYMYMVYYFIKIFYHRCKNSQVLINCLVYKVHACLSHLLRIYEGQYINYHIELSIYLLVFFVILSTR